VPGVLPHHHVLHRVATAGGTRTSTTTIEAAATVEAKAEGASAAISTGRSAGVT
jgi:hypothetical protein